MPMYFEYDSSDEPDMSSDDVVENEKGSEEGEKGESMVDKEEVDQVETKEESAARKKREKEQKAKEKKEKEKQEKERKEKEKKQKDIEKKEKEKKVKKNKKKKGQGVMPQGACNDTENKTEGKVSPLTESKDEVTALTETEDEDDRLEAVSKYYICGLMCIYGIFLSNSPMAAQIKSGLSIMYWTIKCVKRECQSWLKGLSCTCSCCYLDVPGVPSTHCELSIQGKVPFYNNCTNNKIRLARVQLHADGLIR